MAVFQSKPLNPSKLNQTIQKKPWLFGVPFVLLMVAASYAMTPFAQTRYDLHDQRVKQARNYLDQHCKEYLLRCLNSSQVSKEQELKLDGNRRKFDIREEYFKLSAEANEDWEPKRIQRPKGLPEWGVPPTEPPSKSQDSSKP
ncbi:hypothetical protein WG66_016794 [Moniliophthora roreri]|uniref:Cytochrome c oxidase assembly protein COX16, mitochondrial n=1 Tax=Moniliophthora roreri TaxID=221103 RepID=A0A0W0FT66_MONRR|nr:hypothetical protein WG66_016794 [Moniliophthora roreri]